MSHDILLSLIDVDPDNARKRFDAADLAELAQSIKANGLAVPILLRPIADRYQIVHGERRFRAVQSLGWASIPADVRELDAESASWLALVENVQRADLSPIEEAQAYQAKLSTGITQSALGEKIGKSQSYIATKLRLLKLPDEIQQALQAHTISEGHAKQLLRLAGADHQVRICRKVISEKMSVADLASLMDRAVDAEKLTNEIDRLLGEIANGFDIMFQHMTPAQFRGFMRQDNAFDDEILDFLEGVYSDRYYQVKGKELNRRIDEAKTLPELKAIIDEAGAHQNYLGEYHLRMERRAGELLQSMSHDINA